MPPSNAATRSTRRSDAASAAGPEAAVDAVEAAAVFKTWGQTGPSERRALLLKTADALAAKAPQFIEAIAAETDSSAGWAGSASCSLPARCARRHRSRRRSRERSSRPTYERIEQPLA